MVIRGGFGLNYNQQQIATANNDDSNPPGTSSVPGPNSTSPAHIDPNVLYAVSSSPTNIFGYPANKNVITTFNSAGMPTVDGAGLGGLPNNMPTEYLGHYSLEVEQDFAMPTSPLRPLVRRLQRWGRAPSIFRPGSVSNSFGRSVSLKGAPHAPLGFASMFLADSDGHVVLP
jgi:hypothetical protein